jgi:hypothetical protein
MNPSGLFQRAVEKEIVGGVQARRDRHIRDVHVADGAEAGLGGNQIGGFDPDVGRGIVQDGATIRIDREEGEIAGLILKRRHRRPRRGEVRQLHLHAEAHSDLPGEIDRHAGESPVRRPLRQDWIAEIDRHAQPSQGRQFGPDDLHRHVHCHPQAPHRFDRSG